ncbi:probable G-protein coupled receptor Mth-like 3 isoform X2 [Eurytemora carolleeae]|uniref:probable G-protein coupled receptor Mth-like 3 isoform X2 n=1 Tax=Eurytemora carolleeae TaxID=1294199 RepID=UPI000C784558|nr:probable G-protein coupled receptor Mth-like 3 isoform X2 [Eurytemora carolleeae]|eukprot:XP_023339640.1 probable G-protein coupled receptor Mth-like 3 isoform X2 [Eurytemora affinis]
MTKMFSLVINLPVLAAVSAVNLEHHYVSKCCPGSFILDSTGNNCVEGGNKDIIFPPPFTVLYKDEYMTSSEYAVTRGDFMGKCSLGQVEVKRVDILSTDGRYLVGELKNGSQYLEDWEYYDCADFLIEDDIFHLVIVKCEGVGNLGCLESTCIQKCCPFGFSLTSLGCVEEEQMDYKPTSLILTYYNGSEVLSLQDEVIKIKTDFYNILSTLNHSTRGWECSDVYILNENEFNILLNGSLHHLEFEITDVYCTDTYDTGNGTRELFLVRCVAEVEEEKKYLADPAWENRRMMRLIHIVLISISLLAIFATLVVYLILPDLQNLHGKIIISNLVAMGLVYLFLIVNHSTPLDTISIPLCIGVGYTGYCSILCMIVWMTTMCADLCWTFSRAKIPVHETENKKFLIYSIISWGVPVVGTIALFLFQVYLPESSKLNPRVGHFQGECFVARAGDRIRLLLYIPILVLMIINVCLFIIIVGSIFISKVKTRGIRTSTRSDKKGKEGNRITQKTKEQLTDFGNGSVSDMVQHNVSGTIPESPSHEVLFSIIDCLNLLRGVFLFLIFVCKRNVFNKLRDKFSGKPNKGGLRQGSSNKTVCSKLSVNNMLDKGSGKERGNFGLNLAKTGQEEAKSVQLAKNGHDATNEGKSLTKNEQELTKNGSIRAKSGLNETKLRHDQAKNGQKKTNLRPSLSKSGKSWAKYEHQQNEKMSKEIENDKNVKEKVELGRVEEENHEIDFSSKESEPDDLIRKC